MPHVEDGMTVGLFGGTFNPPHHGHVAIANIALKKLALNQLWWIITPANPTKDPGLLDPLKIRIALSKALAKDPRIRVTAFESCPNQGYTLNTILNIKDRNKFIRLIWIMGADNLKTFHHWHKWEKIVMTIPIAIIDRPDITLNYISCPMAKAYNRSRIDESLSGNLCNIPPPAWTFIHDKHHMISSSTIREREKMLKNNPT
ncbi:nicotinate-nucleotide adenylyltransferase [Candidatus Liberibacter sp.]|uniref:nicotinate-nucleotide adenylyltransferase n=1 Tax=Candidatus Liberibacter sp. TaxID=34022 RepID=UPI0015F4C12C|nr:nicotinate-nucleotide adenylyltransferase [Candidatus Liberibacter sp.]MBA5723656.1 nicotinate-nucleotide adenylyltransferase [Candidatus Liberibacter sp.]